MTRPISAFVFVASCIACGLLLLAGISQVPYAVTQDSEGWGSMFLRLYVAPIIGGGTLLFCVLPSAVLYRRGRHRLDLASLWISGVTLGLAILGFLLVEPLRQSIIFGH